MANLHEISRPYLLSQLREARLNYLRAVANANIVASALRGGGGMFTTGSTINEIGKKEKKTRVALLQIAEQCRRAGIDENTIKQFLPD